MKRPPSPSRARPRAAPAPAPAAPPRLVAAIDIGATAIRMEIAQLGPGGTPKTLESLSQPAGLGKDTFTSGSIRRETIEECVRILRRFRKVMDEYGIRDPSAIRAIATSAVQEAANRDRFLDRVFIATQIQVDCVEDIELSRLTYLAIRDLLAREGGARARDALVVEVGGGSTEVLLMQGGHVTFSETYRLGALRMRETLESGRAPADQQRRTLAEDIHRTVEQMVHSIPVRRIPTMIAISGDVRLAASRLVPGWESARLGVLPPRDLARFVEPLLGLDADALVRRHRMTPLEAETLGPALLSYGEIARAFGVRRILVPKVNLRTALELEMTARPEWAGEFRDQVRHSAAALAARYHVDVRHADQVADISLRLFRALQPLHGLGPRHGFLLEIAARLHEVGLFVNNRSHHKHSMYLILNSDLFGVTREDLLLIALIARYHRRSAPLPEHPYYGTLPREQRLVVQKLAAILRVADALERSHLQRVRDFTVERTDGRLTVTIGDVEDLTIERMAIREKGGLFEDIYGVTIDLDRGHAMKGPEGNV
ncbi:MAG: HD domain-containing protein [Lentisphaerae bacterium]|nr:HD domain-containing protein [Lentisphaerota bacterium]